MDFGTQLRLRKPSFQEAWVSEAVVVLHLDGCICLEKMDGWEAFVIQVILSLIDKNKPVMSSQVNPFPAYLFQDLSLRISKGEFDKFNNNSYQVKVTMF